MKILPGVERFVRSYRPYFSPSCHRTYRRVRNRRALSESGDPGGYAFVDTGGLRLDGPQGRRIYLLYTFFDRAGYRVLFRDDFRFLGDMRRPMYKRLLLDRPFGVVRDWAEIPGPFVWISENEESSLPEHCRRHVRLVFDRPFEEAPGRLPLPFSMNPMAYERREDERLDELRAVPKSWRLFFGGNVDPRLYDRDELRRRYGKLTRNGVLRTVVAAIGEDRVARVTDPAELDRLVTEGFSGLVLVAGSYRIPSERWLENLSRSEFFLACPGSRWPMSHNIIEALALGVIPLTEYPEQFFPPLTAGENCVVFSGVDDLAAKVKALLEIGDAELQQLRAGAIEYYERHLSITSFFSRWNQTPERRLELHPTPHLFPS